MAKVENVSLSLPHDLVTAIYEDVQGEKSWGLALRLLGAAVDSHNTSLRVVYDRGHSPREIIVAVSPDPRESRVRQWQEESAHELLPPRLALGEAQLSHWNDAEMSPETAKVRREYQLDWTVSMCIEVKDHTRCIIQCNRSEEQGAYSEGDIACIKAAGEHFGRAIALRRSIINSRVTGEFQAEALDRMGIGGILIEPNRAIVPLNRAAEAILQQGDGLSVINYRLVATDHRNDAVLQQAIKCALEGVATPGSSRGVSLSRRSGKRDLGVVVNTRIFRSVITNEPQSCALVFVRQPEYLASADVLLMQQLFGFTRAEARLGTWLASGMRLEDIEGILNIRHNTARAHLRSMYCKTNVNCQSELVHLLASCAVPLGRPSGEEMSGTLQ